MQVCHFKAPCICHITPKNIIDVIAAMISEKVYQVHPALSRSTTVVLSCTHKVNKFYNKH